VNNSHDFDKMTTNQKLESLNNSLAELRHLLSGLVASNGLEDWVDLNTAMQMTGLKKSTLYKMRKENKISHSSISGKHVFLRKSDLVSLLNEHEKMRE